MTVTRPELAPETRPRTSRLASRFDAEARELFAEVLARARLTCREILSDAPAGLVELVGEVSDAGEPQPPEAQALKASYAGLCEKSLRRRPYRDSMSSASCIQ